MIQFILIIGALYLIYKYLIKTAQENRMKNPFSVIYGKDYIQIKKNDKEVLYWDIQEWTDDPDLLFSICNAVSLASRNKLDPILKEIEKKCTCFYYENTHKINTEEPVFCEKHGKML